METSLSKIEAVVADDMQGLRLDKALAILFPGYSRTFLRVRVEHGMVWVDDRRLRPRDKVQGGERVVVDLGSDPIRASSPPPLDVPLSVVAEDEHMVVLDKPAGLVVHPAAGHADDTLLNALLHRFPELGELPRAGIVHRLDKDTSGLLMVARSRLALHSLSVQLRERSIKRVYHCLVRGAVVAGGMVDAPIARHPRDRKRMAVVLNGRAAVTRYHVLERFAGCTLLSVELETGRTHQIRVHLAHARYPVVGDPVYGVRLRVRHGDQAQQGIRACLAGFNRQALHARFLSFKHPLSGELCRYHSHLPEDFRRLLDCLRNLNSAQTTGDFQ